MAKDFNTGRLKCVRNGAWQILQHYTSRHVGETILELRTIITHITTDVDEEWRVGIPTFCLSLERILIQPTASVLLFQAHVLD